MNHYEATPEQWADTEYYGNPNRKPCPNLESSCLLELRARVEALEARTRELQTCHNETADQQLELIGCVWEFAKWIEREAGR